MSCLYREILTITGVCFSVTRWRYDNAGNLVRTRFAPIHPTLPPRKQTTHHLSARVFPSRDNVIQVLSATGYGVTVTVCISFPPFFPPQLHLIVVRLSSSVRHSNFSGAFWKKRIIVENVAAHCFHVGSP